jgi:hypothetical protein
MADKGTNKTIWTLAIIGGVGYLGYKIVPKLLKKMTGSAGSGGAGGAGASSYAPYNPYNAQGNQSQGPLAQLSLSSLPGSKAGQTTQPNYDYPSYGPAALTQSKIDSTGIIAGMDQSDYQNATTDAAESNAINGVAYNDADFPGDALNSPSNNAITSLFNSIFGQPNVEGPQMPDASIISQTQAQSYDSSELNAYVNDSDNFDNTGSNSGGDTAGYGTSNSEYSTGNSGGNSGGGSAANSNSGG